MNNENVEQGQEAHHLGQREDIISNVRKMKWSCGRAHQLPQKATMDIKCMSPLGDHTTRKDDKADQPNNGEETWTKLIVTGHDLAEDSTRQANLEAVC